MENGKLDLEKWKIVSKIEQKFLSNLLCNRSWDEIEHPQHRDYLTRKITLPLLERNGSTLNCLTAVENIKSIIEKYTDKGIVNISIIFIFVWKYEESQSMFPLVRVKSNQDPENVADNVFIDHNGKEFTCWEDYKNNNTCFRSWLCVPKNGFYCVNGKFDILDQTLRRGKDVISASCNDSNNNNSFIATYNWYKNTVKPYISAEKLSLGIPAHSVAPSRSLISVSDPKKKYRKFSLEKNVIDLFYTVSRKDEINRIIDELIDSVFFFTHIFVPKDQVLCIENIAFENKTQIESRAISIIPEKQRLYDTFLKGFNEINKPSMVIKNSEVFDMDGEKEFVMYMNDIDGENVFCQFEMEDQDENFYINRQLTIHPRSFLQMEYGQRVDLLNFTKQLKESKIDLSKVEKRMSKILKKYVIRIDSQNDNTKKYLTDMFNVSQIELIDLGGSLLPDTEINRLDRLEEVVRKCFDTFRRNVDRALICELREKLMALVNKLTKRLETKTVADYCAVAEYTVKKMKDAVTLRRYTTPIPPGGNDMSAGYPYDYMSKLLDETLFDETKINSLFEEFTTLCEKCSNADKGAFKFSSSVTAANHYNKHCKFEDKELSVGKYFEIASKILDGSEYDEQNDKFDMIWTQDGSSLKYTFVSKKHRATVIKFVDVSNGEAVIASFRGCDKIENELKHLIQM